MRCRVLLQQLQELADPAVLAQGTPNRPCRHELVPDRRVVDRAGELGKPLFLGDGTPEGKPARLLPDMLRRVLGDPDFIARRAMKFRQCGSASNRGPFGMVIVIFGLRLGLAIAALRHRGESGV